MGRQMHPIKTEISNINVFPMRVGKYDSAENMGEHFPGIRTGYHRIGSVDTLTGRSLSVAGKKGAIMAGGRAPLAWLRRWLRQRGYQPNSMAMFFGESSRLPYRNFGWAAATQRFSGAVGDVFRSAITES